MGVYEVKTDYAYLPLVIVIHRFSPFPCYS